MGNDSFPHTSRLSLQSCLICPKQSQEETTVLMPLKSGHRYSGYWVEKQKRQIREFTQESDSVP